MLSTGVGTHFIHGAAAGDRIQKPAIPAGTTGEREDGIPEIEMLDHTRLAEAPGNLLGRFVLGFKRINQLKPQQIRQLDLDRHGAAVGYAVGTQTIAITGPGLQAVDVDTKCAGC